MGDVNTYVTKYEQLVRAAGYKIDADLTINIFMTGLPRALYEKIFQDDHPTTYEQWKECVIMCHQQWIHMQAHMGQYQEPICSAPNWCALPNPNAMDTSARRTRGRLATAKHVLEQYAS